NESLSGFVREAFETAAIQQGRGSLRDKRRSLYSRHLLDLDFDEEQRRLEISMLLDPPAPEEYDNNMTYPYNKFTGARTAKQIKAYGKSLRERGPVSPRIFQKRNGNDQQSSARDTSPPQPAGILGARHRLSLPTPDEINLKRKPPKISFAMYDETIPPIDQTAPPTARRKFCGIGGVWIWMKCAP
ncbi:unnamed protein product, partial [Mesorhabditis spiculigera]